MEPIISFRDYSFRYRSQKEPTLKNINLDIYPGEKILIAGQSGSGKSTLAHCMNALIPCSFAGDVSGTLKVAGADPAAEGVFGMSKTVGTVLQDTDGQFIGLTVAEDIAFALENDAVPQDELIKKVQAAAQTVEMTEYLDKSPAELSGGQKQRVSLGGVMVDDVKILLFDEPLANLDPATGKNTISLMEGIMHKKDVTVVIIEHRLEDVLYEHVDRVIVMGEGEIVADMKPDDLLCSDILIKHGIREPLYVTALKHAGCTIRPEDRPDHIDHFNTEPYKEKLKEWFSAMPRKERVKSTEEVLKVKNLTFSYDDTRTVLKDVSFTVNKGEVIALVGKNGAGKSTLASLICGFYKPDAGDIYLNGSDISVLSIAERGERIGYVMQSPNQMISKPMISEEVGLGLTVRNVPEEEVTERVNDTLRICGLYPYRNWPVGALSFGQKKRVSIASILVMKPDILIMDEPTAGQDYAHYTEIMEFIKDLRDRMDLTIIMITHDMHLMLEYTDRALVLCDGQLLTDSTPAEVLSDDKISERAYLKKTSLYDLSVKCDIYPPTDFIDRFISYERSHRGEGGAHV
ncbi:MAG: ABC transporter ATP-binding protein [Lachnospiraceae bacterium]|nr:ABC transporter ATP-binding protein [Lachnospiraceae bacterium]